MWNIYSNIFLKIISYKINFHNINDKNFIRAHTCFNRIDLPNFPNIESLHEAIKFALENEVLGFGIE